MNKKYIVTKSKEVEEIIKKGTKDVSKFFVIYNIERKNQKINKYCISVSKRVGKANVRNKIKRRIKDILMKNKLEFGKDYVIIVRQGLIELKYNDIKKELLNVIKEK